MKTEEKKKTPAHESTAEPAARTLTIERVFPHRRDRVWKAWTEPEHIAQWWGPKGFTARVHEYDLTPGGRWRCVMIGPDGTEYPSEGIFREVVAGERIVTTDEFGEGIEEVLSADLPEGIVVTATFDDLGNRTRLTLFIEHATAEDRWKHEKMGVVEGWNSSLDCLDEHLRTM